MGLEMLDGLPLAEVGERLIDYVDLSRQNAPNGIARPLNKEFYAQVNPKP